MPSRQGFVGRIAHAHQEAQGCSTNCTCSGRPRPATHCICQQRYELRTTAIPAVIGQLLWACAGAYSAASSVVWWAASLPPTCRESMAHAALTCSGATPRYFMPGFGPLALAWRWPFLASSWVFCPAFDELSQASGRMSASLLAHLVADNTRSPAWAARRRTTGRRRLAPTWGYVESEPCRCSGFRL